MNKRTRENLQAEVLIGIHGETTDPFKRTAGYKWAIDGWAPEYSDYYDHGDSRCITVLAHGLRDPGAPKGYAQVETFETGERECPWCGPGTGRSVEETKECELCEGSGLIYWGEEWQIVVFAPEYVYGSGEPGCLYDNGPHRACTMKEALDSLSQTFDSLPARALQRMRGDLKRNGIHYFPTDVMARNDAGELESIRSMAGVGYCEVSK